MYVYSCVYMLVEIMLIFNNNIKIYVNICVIRYVVQDPTFVTASNQVGYPG